MHSTEENSLPKNTPLDMNKWTEIVNAWNASNENQKSYCNRLGINLNTFSYVRGKLLKKSNPKTKFIPVSVNFDSTPSRVSIITLENKEGLKLHIPTTMSAEQLLKIIKICGW